VCHSDARRCHRVCVCTYVTAAMLRVPHKMHTPVHMKSLQPMILSTFICDITNRYAHPRTLTASSPYIKSDNKGMPLPGFESDLVSLEPTLMAAVPAVLDLIASGVKKKFSKGAYANVLCLCVCARIHAHAHMFDAPTRKDEHGRTHACMHERTHTHTHTHASAHTHTCTHTCKHTHANMRVHTQTSA